ncbi:MAG TPA: helix-turn-helix transcriptional regulator [Alphaproteobacteria bacterium]|nr:helix-turn-helix transcriptional regulator [Alphaproteobacteria bacterium]
MDAGPGSGSGGAPKGGRPHAIDVHVGHRLRLRRTLLGLSQGALAHRVGLTFQQIQKYERGINRIGASRLAEFAVTLGVPPGWFFEEMPGTPRSSAEALRRNAVRLQGLGGRETLELVRLFNRVRDRRVRERILALLRAVVSDGSDHAG